MISKYNILIIIIISGLFFSCHKENYQEEITPEDIISKTLQSMKLNNNFEFSLHHEKGFIDIGNNINLLSAKGRITENGISIDSESSLGRALIKTSAIVIGNRTWITNPITQSWIEIPSDESPLNFINLDLLISEILGDINDITLNDQNPESYYISANSNSNSFTSLVGSVVQNKNVNIELEIDKNSNLITKVIIYGQVQKTDKKDFKRIIKFYSYGKNNILSPPKIDD